MKRYCKHIDITNRDFVKQAVMDCLIKKFRRRDVIELLSEYSKLSMDFIESIIQSNYKTFLNGIIETIVDGMIQEIKDKNIKLKPIWYSEKIDESSKKIRRIGIQSVKQQLYDYLAVYAMMELFKKKIGYYQCAAIKGRGQVYGKNAIAKWLRKPNTKYAVKGDIKKCYESINKDILKQKLGRCIKNDTILYLVYLLIDTFEQGLSIGSYLSQFLCNFYLSFAYHFLEDKVVKVRKRRGKETKVRLIKHQLWYMDDFIIIGGNKRDVKQAMLLLINFLHTELQLQVKDGWEVFLINYKNRGKFIDMMGFKIYRDHVCVRRRVFLRARRCYRKALKTQKFSFQIAHRCISYYGWFKNSDSYRFIKKYKVEQIIKKAKERIRDESTFHRKTACRALAGTR